MADITLAKSMLASIRHMLKFIELDTAFDEYGFIKKVPYKRDIQEEMSYSHSNSGEQLSNSIRKNEKDASTLQLRLPFSPA